MERKSKPDISLNVQVQTDWVTTISKSTLTSAAALADRAQYVHDHPADRSAIGFQYSSLCRMDIFSTMTHVRYKHLHLSGMFRQVHFLSLWHTHTHKHTYHHHHRHAWLLLVADYRWQRAQTPKSVSICMNKTMARSLLVGHKVALN